MRSLLLALALTATPALAQANPQIDYPAFQALAASVAPERAQRLIAFDAFKAEAAKPEALLLDARSKDAFQRGHIKGAVNLPLTEARKRVVWGKSVSVRVDFGGGRIIKKKN